MPNPYFTFKQFTIRQDACAMKVCTDACLFGAWVANAYKANGAGNTSQHRLPVTSILDIGAGTGLLSLMLAQKMNAPVTAIEMDSTAFMQMKSNVESSPWHDRITPIQGDATNYCFDKKYDLIICNPPFFANSLRAADKSKNMAKHEASLTLEKLVGLAAANLATEARLWILLPYFRSDHFLELAGSAGFHLLSHLAVRQTPRHDYFRSMLQFGMQPATTTHTGMYIKDGNNYSAAFTALLKDYYFYL